MLQDLTKWRMNLAVMKLKKGEKVTPELIEQLGYKSNLHFGVHLRKYSVVIPVLFKPTK